jgi:hypothetical protein
MDDVIHAYTPQDWGLGGSLPSGNYTTRSAIGLWVVVVLLTVPAILSPLMMIAGAASLNPGIFILFLICTLLFTGGWFVGVRSLQDEARARELRRAKDLPKPWSGVTDDQARNWFEQRPGTVSITRDNFPNSTRAFPGEGRIDA